MRIVRIGVYNEAMSTSAHSCPAANGATLVPNPNPRAFRFTDLSAGQRTLLIEHAGQVYRLSLTGQNKLILTK